MSDVTIPADVAKEFAKLLRTDDLSKYGRLALADLLDPGTKSERQVVEDWRKLVMLNENIVFDLIEQFILEYPSKPLHGPIHRYELAKFISERITTVSPLGCGRTRSQWIRSAPRSDRCWTDD